MQRSTFWLLIVVALYVSACTSATRSQPAPIVKLPPPAPIIQVAPPALPPVPSLPVVEPATTVEIPSTTVESAPLPVVSLPPVFAENPAPHIALILPLNSPAFGRSAEAVQKGFFAAASQQEGALPIRVYAASDEAKEAVTLYRRALVNGARAIVGPLTRNGVAAINAYHDIAEPTLALNTPDNSKASAKLYFFGLAAEAEARQVAQLGIAANHNDVTIVSTNSMLSRRLVAAFTDEWKMMGGSVTAELVYSDDPSTLVNLPVAPWPPGMEPPPPVSAVTEVEPGSDKRPPKPPRILPPLIAPSNMVFLAADMDKARLIRPYLNPNIPVYGTSQLFRGNSDALVNYDLNEIRFIDMPWLLQPDHPAVMIYPHAIPPLDIDRERLYALGIDAYRLIQVMLSSKLEAALPLDGVTGRISMGSNHQLQREPVLALFKLGRGLTPEALAAINAAKAAEKAADRAAAKAAAENADNALTSPAQ